VPSRVGTYVWPSVLGNLAAFARHSPKREIRVLMMW
jgi:hypothetical protein